MSALHGFMAKYHVSTSASNQEDAPKQHTSPAPPLALCDGKVNGSSNEDLDLQKELMQPEPSNDGEKAVSLEEFEQQAYDKLLAKKNGKTMKRPSASAVATAKPKATVGKAKVTQKQSSAWKPQCGVYGCIRCRGNVNGCESCKNPLFAGKRFASRRESQKWQDKRNSNK